MTNTIRTMSRLCTIAVLAALAACASTRRVQAPRLAGTVPLQITLRGSLYTGTASIDENTRGTFTVRGPVEVTGTLNGRMPGDSIVLQMTYTIAANNCKGTMEFAGTFKSRESKLAEGPVNALDSCVGKLAGTLRIGQ